MDSYGYVETRGLVTAIEAADAALKAANVTLTNCYYVKGGIVTIEVMGDVAAVNAAVDAASESAKRLGNFLSSNVIARVASETKKILISDIGKKSDKQTDTVQNDEKIIEELDNENEKIEVETVPEEVFEQAVDENSDIQNENQVTEEQSEDITEKIETEEKPEEVIQEITENEEAEQQNDIIQENEEVSVTETLKKKDEETKEEIKKAKKHYQDMKVADLKTKVNSLKLGYTWNQIKTMPKKKLIEILIKNNQEE